MSAMAMMSNLLYYASVVRDRSVPLAEHFNSKDEDLSAVSAESLSKLPEFHNRFAYTMDKRTFMFLMEESFTYTAIVDEALGKLKGFGFLERVRDEFQLMLRARGLDAARLERNAMSADFGGVYKHLVKPLIGVPQKDLVEDLEVSSVEREDRGIGSPTQIGSPSHHEAGHQQQHHHHSNGNGSKGGKKENDQVHTYHLFYRFFLSTFLGCPSACIVALPFIRIFTGKSLCHFNPAACTRSVDF